jgi:hypothetical protein
MSIQNPARVGPAYAGPEGAGISRIGAFAAATVFGMVGVTLVALAAAFPLSLEVVATHHLAVPPGDLALASRIAPLWPAFALAGAANLAAGVAVLDGGVLGKRIALVIGGIGAALTAATALVTTGSLADVATALAGAYLVALVGTIVVQRRSA